MLNLFPKRKPQDRDLDINDPNLSRWILMSNFCTHILIYPLAKFDELTKRLVFMEDFYKSNDINHQTIRIISKLMRNNICRVKFKVHKKYAKIISIIHFAEFLPHINAFKRSNLKVLFTIGVYKEASSSVQF
jgi:hypothetical protein